jgi:hypothetical protein
VCHARFESLLKSAACLAIVLLQTSTSSESFAEANLIRMQERATAAVAAAAIVVELRNTLRSPFFLQKALPRLL